MRLRYTRVTALREVLFVAVGIAFAFPIYILVSGTLKKDLGEVVRDPLGLPQDATLSNFERAWDLSGGPGRTSLSQGMVNSTVITVSTVVLLVLVGSLVSYFIARRASKLSGGLFTFFLLGLVVPGQLSLVPLFSLLRTLGLLGTYPGIVLVYTGFFMPAAVFFFSTFIRRVPAELEESALVDGAGRLRIFSSIVLPLMRPIIVTTTIIAGLFVWNDLFVSLVVLGGGEKGTLPLVIYSLVGSGGLPDWPIVFSTIMIAISPMLIVFVFAQRYMVEGLSGGLRG